jgi:hypothetical protein
MYHITEEMKRDTYDYEMSCHNCGHTIIIPIPKGVRIPEFKINYPEKQFQVCKRV